MRDAEAIKKRKRDLEEALRYVINIKSETITTIQIELSTLNWVLNEREAK